MQCLPLSLQTTDIQLCKVQHLCQRSPILLLQDNTRDKCSFMAFLRAVIHQDNEACSEREIKT